MQHKRVLLVFLPLLVVYVAVAATGWHRPLVHDEVRYVEFARTIAQGGRSQPGEVSLWHGPGYSLWLTPFVAIGAGHGLLRLFNAFLLFAAIWFFFRFLSNHLKSRTALTGAWLLGLYFPVWKSLPMLMSEVLALCQVCFLLWSWSEILRSERRPWAWTAAGAFAFAWLCLTRVVFGYVLAACLIVFAAFSLAKRGDRRARRLLSVHVLALVLCVPWLGYTYSRTGKVFHWSAAGGLSLYWMTTPVSGEWGDWHASEDVLSEPRLAHHHNLFRRAAGLGEVARDDAFKAAAIANLRRYPVSYIKNVAANLSRLFFSFPYSYTPQKMSTLFYAVSNAFLLSFLVLAFVSLWRERGASFSVLYPYWLLGGVAFLGTVLLSAYARMLFPIVPIMLFTVVYGLRGISLSSSQTRAS